jgi:hypothetical protein
MPVNKGRYQRQNPENNNWILFPSQQIAKCKEKTMPSVLPSPKPQEMEIFGNWCSKNTIQPKKISIPG